MGNINSVVIATGTHGNEFTGIYLGKKFDQFPNLIQRSSFDSRVFLSNPKAFAAARRYIDKDLNRCFAKADLQNPQLASYEDVLAKNIYSLLKEESQNQQQVIIDLHSSTANMQLTIILKSQHPFLLQLAAELSAINPEVRVCYSQPTKNFNYLCSISELGFAIEVGPVAQAVLNAELFQKTEALIYQVLDYIESYNQGLSEQKNRKLTFYQSTEVIDYPRNEDGEIQAMIHPQLQFRDYEPLNPGEPIFLTFDGKAIAYEGTSTVYPIFINEAAYYEKGIAMCLTQQKILEI
ncbi:aspartoacylase [Nostoc sp. FACHB-152]|uniref:aspartoacylase n=1 Tax=unclassified Nostoc TaxID=2593658 RepID=UPI001685C0A0|nr:MULTISPECIES: aspartoacylase [unclassified Nostoc]MBD2450444.1 aspartoacylase [Nostoc sp. FACHB-152]MBD2471665.1 aspartoacylase [Nostoc sp. FACHB-145]